MSRTSAATVWLEPAPACTAAVAVETLLRWCAGAHATMGVPRVWVSDTARHFPKPSAAVGGRVVGYVPPLCGRELGVEEQDGGTHDAIVRTFKALVNEGCLPLT